jgi:hypothetical protein
MAIVVESLVTAPSPIFVSTNNSAITFLSLCNTTTNDVTINFFVVPNGVVINDSCTVYSELVIPAGDTYQIYVGNEKLLLGPGDSIYAEANFPAAISAVISYTSF